MNTTQHTPGPWIPHWSMGNGGFHHIMVASQQDFGRIAKVYAFAPTDGDMELEAKANARLIAAAPELLEALEALLALHEPTNSLHRRRNEYACARAAIAKAKGVK